MLVTAVLQSSAVNIESRAFCELFGDGDASIKNYLRKGACDKSSAKPRGKHPKRTSRYDVNKQWQAADDVAKKTMVKQHMNATLVLEAERVPRRRKAAATAAGAVAAAGGGTVTKRLKFVRVCPESVLKKYKKATSQRHQVLSVPHA